MLFMQCHWDCDSLHPVMMSVVQDVVPHCVCSDVSIIELQHWGDQIPISLPTTSVLLVPLHYKRVAVLMKRSAQITPLLNTASHAIIPPTHDSPLCSPSQRCARLCKNGK